MPPLTNISNNFREVIEQANSIVAETAARGDDDFSALSELNDCVYIKNDEGVLIFTNESHRRFFSGSASPLGRTARAFLDKSIAPASQQLDELVRRGCEYVECVHTGRGPDGGAYRLMTHKRTLKRLGSPGLAILGVTRVLEAISGPEAEPLLELSDAFRRFRELNEKDQEICRMTSLGSSSRELAEQFGMTTRGIELRKQKAFASLGVAKAVDLVRLLVRLQDRGYLDLGL